MQILLQKCRCLLSVSTALNTADALKLVVSLRVRSVVTSLSQVVLRSGRRGCKTWLGLCRASSAESINCCVLFVSSILVSVNVIDINMCKVLILV